MARAPILAVLAVLPWTCVVAAQPLSEDAQPTAADLEEARLAFAAGRAAYDAGRFEHALTEFRHAFSITHDPQMLYNIGVVAERLRSDEEALDAYTRYLDAFPDAPERASIESRIGVLRRGLTERAEPAPDDTRPPVEPERGPEPRIGAFVATGAAGLLGGLALVLWLVADAEYVSLVDACPCTEEQIASSSVRTLDGLTTFFLVASIASAVTAVTLFVLEATIFGDRDLRVAMGPGSVQLRVEL